MKWFDAWDGCPCDFSGSHSINLLLSIHDLGVRFGFSSTGFVLVACMHDGYCQGCTLSMSMWRHWLMVQFKSRASNMVHTPIQHCYVHDGSTVSIYSITELYMYKPCSNSPLLWLVPSQLTGLLEVSASTLPASTMWSQAVYSCLSHTLHPLDFNCFLFCASNLSYIPTYKYATLHSC